MKMPFLNNNSIKGLLHKIYKLLLGKGQRGELIEKYLSALFYNSERLFLVRNLPFAFRHLPLAE